MNREQAQAITDAINADLHAINEDAKAHAEAWQQPAETRCDICDRPTSKTSFVLLEGTAFYIGPCCVDAIAEMPTALFGAKPPDGRALALPTVTP